MSEAEEIKVKPKLSEDLKQGLKLRKILKSKKPEFIRMDSWAKPSIEKSSWRRPKGLDNKIKLQRKGFPKIVKIGYRGPRVVRGLHPSGFREVVVHNVQDLKNVDPLHEAIRIASTVGRRKREEILKRAKELKIKVLN